MNTLLRTALLGATLAGFANAQVVINELSYDAPGGDGLQVFVEIYGPAGTDVSGWQLVAYDGVASAPGMRLSEDFTFPMGTLIPDDGGGFGVLVVADGDIDGGTTMVANADFVDADMDLQNGPDAIVLVDAMSVVVDALGYGDLTGRPTIAIDGPAAGQNWFEGSGARDVFAPLSLQRCPGGFDTNDNSVDFTGALPTPGVAVERCAGLEQSNISGGAFNAVSLSLGEAIGIDTFTSFGAGLPQVMLVSFTDPAVTPSPIPGFPVFDATTSLFLNAVNSTAFQMFFIIGLPVDGDVLGNQIVFDTTGLPASLSGLPFTLYMGYTVLTPTGFFGSSNFATVTVNP